MVLPIGPFSAICALSLGSHAPLAAGLSPGAQIPGSPTPGQGPRLTRTICRNFLHCSARELPVETTKLIKSITYDFGM